ncbi:DNA repair protein RecO [Gracilinema caldarium]|uniref:DNA repair protein RecO n=1 Tax=Gracilinema caldarium (strain ATCC 51460 / DSM 7334 / H1) TaxID=744872 RepID=F8EXT7_GRAC1|nr:DNA repair protein RecO [Gracilinema caldarium]AEJ20101.1 DNA repair protein recO [Gracilinema caldarium DSM 7334]
MSRSRTYTALVLQVRQSGEQNREAIFFTLEEGILRATLFGGPKSKLRSYVSPFHQGKLWIYEDPVRNTKKITDFDVQFWRPTLRESYAKLMAGSTMLEIVIASQGGGGTWKEAFELTTESIEVLNRITEASIPILITYFVWNWLNLMGILPELDQCERCACTVRADEVVWYSSSEQQVLCDFCAEPVKKTIQTGLFPINGGGRRWISRILELPASQVERYRVDEATQTQVQHLGTALLQQTLGTPVRYWEIL